jgi:ATP-binding cassette subfamily B protein
MRHSSGHHHGSADSKIAQRGDWRVIRDLLPYLLEYRFRVLIAIGCLIAAKVTNLGIPIVLKDLIDSLNINVNSPQVLLVVPLGIIIAYGLLRIFASVFSELREALFAKVTQNAVRKVALQVFEHLHSLALSFHLARQTGGVSRDIERGTRGIQSLISYSLYSILPTLIEFCLVLGYLAYSYDIWFAAITLVALALYIVFTVVVTEWRTHFRRTMNDMDSKANQKAVDSLLNFETVKCFGNEAFEASRYDKNLLRYQSAAVKSQKTLVVLNLGQQILIAVGLMLILWRATVGVVNGTMTLGDLVLVNTLMIQL